MKEDYEDFKRKRLTEAAIADSSITRVWKNIHLKKVIPYAMLDKGGRRTTERREIEKICQTYYNDLFSSKRAITMPTLEHTEEISEVPAEEVWSAIRKMKPEKAAGPDETRLEEMRAGGGILAKALSTRFSKYIREGRLPKQWKKARTVLIPKKGIKEDIKNFRPITLLFHMYKVFMRVIYRTIKRTLDEHTSRNQAGFRKRFSSIDHIFTVT